MGLCRFCQNGLRIGPDQTRQANWGNSKRCIVVVAHQLAVNVGLVSVREVAGYQLNVVQGLPVFLYGNTLADGVDQIIAHKAGNTSHGRRFQISHTGVSFFNIHADLTLGGTV